MTSFVGVLRERTFARTMEEHRRREDEDFVGEKARKEKKRVLDHELSLVSLFSNIRSQIKVPLWLMYRK